ncbi:MAG: fatty acid desaturase [Proteobacteria bacterium]|nr:fatty acid desaturase [Pseudomonadota bacterium]
MVVPVLPDNDSNADVHPTGRYAGRQIFHFLLCDILPLILMLVAPIWLPAGWFCWFGVAVLLGMWTLVAGVGITVGFHRLFTHRSFKAKGWVKVLAGVAGSMSAQGPLIYWAALHRRHHACSDRPGDPHSPVASADGKHSKLAAFFAGHIGWVTRHDVPKASRYVIDLLNDHAALFVSNTYWLSVFLGIALPTAIGWLHFGTIDGAVIGLYWGGIVRIALGQHIVWSVNSVCHTFGSRPYNTKDQSTNYAVLCLITFGESWHNNHHWTPASPKLGHRWWQIDIGWWIIGVLRVLGGAELRSK